ncbi:MAG: choice-of-anchor D domain-containing protein [bacterium]
MYALLMFGAALAPRAEAQSSWPRFRFDAGLNGRASVNGPILPELQWTVQIGAEKIESPVVAADGSIVFISRGDEFVYALNPDGSLKWKFALARRGGGGNETFSAPPAIGKDGNIYVGTQQGSFFSIDLNGGLRWRAAVGGFVSCAANVDGDGNLYVPVDDGRLYVFKPNGDLLCTANFDGVKPGNTPALGANGRVYAPAGNNVYIFDSACNTIAKWSHPALGEVAWVVLNSNGSTLYAGSRTNAAVVAFNASSGQAAWVHTYDQSFGPPSPAAIGPDGSIYFASFDRGMLQALTPSGRPRTGWPFDLGSSHYKTMPVVDRQGNLFIVNERPDFGLVALTANGEMLWRMPEVQCKYSIAFGPNGTLYIPSLKKIYAVRQHPPKIVARPNPVDFGQVCLNSTAVLTDTIFNEGSSDLILSAFELNSAVFAFEASPRRLRPGESLVISLRFTPNAAGVFQDTLFVSSNDPDRNPYSIVLRGEGLAPQITGPANVIFPVTEVGLTSVDTVIIRAAGSCSLRVDSVRVAGANAADFSFVLIDPLGELAPNGSLRVRVTFAPRAEGERNAALHVFSNDPDTQPLVVPLRGIGATAQPRWTVSPSTLTFVACLDTIDRGYVQINNVGFVNVIISSASISNSAFAIDTTGLIFPFTLPPGQSLFVPLRFTPVDTNTTAGVLNFQSNAGLATVSLNGKGEGPRILLAARPPRLEICRGQSTRTQIVVVNPSASCELRVDSFKVAIAFFGPGLAASSSFLSHQASAPIIIAPGDSTVIPFEVTQPPRDFELRVTFWSNASGSPHVIAVPGRVLVPAIAAVDTVEFGLVPVQQFVQMDPLLVWNTGRCDLRITSARITGRDSSSFSVDLSRLPSLLSAGDSLFLPLTFSPRRAGDHLATLLLANDDPDLNPVRIVLHGTARDVSVFPQPSQIVFGGVCLGSDSTLVVEIVNNGSDTVVAASISFVLGRPEFSVEPRTDFLVPAGARRALTIGFTPQTLERVADTLRIVWVNPSVPTVLIPVSGEAVSGQIAGPEEHVFPPTIVNQTEIDTIYVRNIGACDLVVDSTVIVKDLAATASQARTAAQDPPFTVIGDFTARSILPGDSLGIPVAFTPHAAGLFVASLLVYNSDPDREQDNPLSVRLIGNGQPVPPKAPDIAVAQDTLGFGTACEVVVRNFEISNTGDTTLTIVALTFSNPAYSTTQSVPFVLLPGEKKALLITFNPAAARSAQDTLTIASNDPDEDPYRVVLLGSKSQPSIAGASLQLFPPTSIGNFSQRVYVFYNTGVCSLRVNALVISGQHPDDFIIIAAPATPFDVEAGDSARVTINFAPKDSLARSATLSISNNDGDENPKIVQLQGNGSAPAISVWPNPFDFGKVRVGQDSCAFVFIENNSLDSLATTSAVLRTGVPFHVEGQGLDLLISPGGKAAIAVCFTPLAPGVFSDILDVPIAKVFNGIAGKDSLFSIALKGEGTTAAIYAQSPISVGAERLGRFINVTAYGGIKNTGTAPLTILTLQQPGSDFTVTLLPFLPLRLQPGESKDVHVTFRPSRDGDLRGSFVIISDAFEDTLRRVELVGRGFVDLEAALTVYPEVLDFGALFIQRESKDSSFYVINNGPLELHDVRVRLGDSREYEILSPSFPYASLPSKDSILVMVKFRPVVSGIKNIQALADSRETLLAPRIVDLTGEGRSRPNQGVRVRPEVFTPNHDGYNDVARFEFPDLTGEVFEPVIKIFNMRGQLIGILNLLEEQGVIAWDGRDDRGNLVAPHTYLWYLQDGDKVFGSGHVGVVR